MISAIFAIIVNYVFCNLLINNYEIGGLAMASSISVTLNAIILAIPLLSKKEYIFDSSFFIQLVKIFISSICMYLVILFILPLFTFDTTIMKIIGLGIIFLLSIIVYFVLAFILKIEQMDFVKNKLKRK